MNVWDDQFQQQQQEQYVVQINNQQHNNDSLKKNYKSSFDEPKLQFKLIQKQSQVPINNIIVPKVKILQENWKPHIHFGKDFQSSNLDQIMIESNQTFVLSLKDDTNTKRYSQWFYFSCRDIKYANFIIKGFKKKNSLYNYGMKICIYENNKWIRGGTNISYSQNQEGYQLRFSYKFNYPTSITYFAYSFPYTYTQLKQYISSIQKKKYHYFSKQILCKTYQGNNLYCLSIGNQANKDVIIITARTHPGEVVSSHIIRGFINKLLSSDLESQILREKILFKILPMMNPDGVINGNYRTSYTGNDLNRKWNNASQKLHPQIYYTRNYIMNLKKQKNILMFLDLHGHSRKKNVFFYGCQDDSKDQQVKKFPFLMEKISSYFNFKKSTFQIQKSKAGTARIFLYRQLKIPCVYTLETSFSGNQNQQNNYMTEDYQKIGEKLINGFFINFSQIVNNVNNISKPRKSVIIRKKYERQQKQIKQAIQKAQKFKENCQNQMMILMKEQKDKKDQQKQSQSGSQSAPSEGILKEEQILGILSIKQGKQKKRLYRFEKSQQVKKSNEAKKYSKIKQPNFRIRNYLGSSKMIDNQHELIHQQKLTYKNMGADNNFIYQHAQKKTNRLYTTADRDPLKDHQDSKNKYNQRNKLIKLLMIQRNNKYPNFSNYESRVQMYQNQQKLNNYQNNQIGQQLIKNNNISRRGSINQKLKDFSKMMVINQVKNNMENLPKKKVTLVEEYNMNNRINRFVALQSYFKKDIKSKQQNIYHQNQLKIAPGTNCKKILQKINFEFNNI